MKICSVAHALPKRLVSNDDLVERLAARNAALIPASQLSEMCDYLRSQLTRTGAVTRYHRAEDEKALELGLTAAQRALQLAGLASESIDLLIYTGVGRGFVEPATANVFQSELNLVNATCFDVFDACAGWLRSLDVAHHMIRSGAYRHAMILNSEMNVREYEPISIASRQELEFLWSGYTIGEAATATIINGDDEGGIYRTNFRNAGAHVGDCQIPLPHASQFQNGHHPTALAALRFHARPEVLAGSAIRLLHRQYRSDSLLPSLQFDIIFGHSVSVPVSQAVLRSLKLDQERYYEIFPNYGNVVSASLPLAMSLARADGRLRRGDRVLLIMGGAGLTTALCTFVY